MKYKVVLPSFLIVFLFSVSSHAQVYLPPQPPPLDINKMIVDNYLINQIRINAVGQSMINDSMTRGKTKPGAKTNVTTNSVYAPKLGFKVSGYSLIAEKITQNPSQKISAEDAKKLNDLFNKLWTDFQTSFKDENQRLGMPYNDLATTMAYYILNNYMILNDIPSLESEKTVAVYGQIAPVLLANAEIAKMTDKDKEMLGELFVSIGGMPSLIIQTTRDRQKAKQMAQQNLEKFFGQNAAKMKITEKGVEL